MKLKLSRGSVSKEVVALVNSGYEADTPQLLVPVSVARDLGFMAASTDARETFFETAGGPLKV